MTTDAELIEGAQTRANITGFLTMTPGFHTVAAIAEAVGLSRMSAGQHLALMAKDKLIRFKKDGTSKMYGSKGGKNDIVAESPVDEEKPRRIRTTKDVELLVHGTLIIVGRNPRTGRLRIILEDA